MAPLDDDPPTAEDVRLEAEGLAASEEELVLIALFGEEAEALLRTIRARHSRDDRGETTLEETREQRIRELVRIVQESGVAEVEIEDEGMRVSVRRADERPALQLAAPLADDEPGELPVLPAASAGSIRVESPMVGVFYRQPEPGTPPFVEVGDVVTPGQTLCLLEAMKLFNELKADATGRVTAIHAENGKPVEFGQLLFELEPIAAPPDPLMFEPRARSEPRRDRRQGHPRDPRARRGGRRRLLDGRPGRAARPPRRPRRLHRAAVGRRRATCASRT